MYMYVHTLYLQREESALRAMEEQREKKEKQHKQAETKSDLNYSLKLKMKKKVLRVHVHNVYIHVCTCTFIRCPWYSNMKSVKNLYTMYIHVHVYDLPL